MSKYIIELDDRIKLVTSVGVTENGVVYTTSDYVHNLEELNSDYINEHFGELQDEAYERGYKDGKNIIDMGCEGCKYTVRFADDEPCKICSNCYKNQYEPAPQEDDRIEVGDEAYQKGINDGSLDVKQRVEGAYQRGLEDAWDAAKRIFGYEIDGGLPIDRVREAFGYAENAMFCTADIIRDYTVQEAIDKIKAYEDKRSDRIDVGDEVRTIDGAPSHTFLVTRVTDSHVYGISDDGGWNYWTKDEVTKTGKHYDIASILEAMRK